MTTNDLLPENTSSDVLLNRLQSIAESVMNAAEAGSVGQVLERIAHVSGELVNARYTALGIPDDRGGLRFFKVAGMSAEEVREVGHLPVGRGLLGAIMRERKALRLEDMRQDSRSAGFCARHPNMTSLLGVPIQLGGRFFGILYLCDRLDGQPFSEQDQRLVEIMASYAALAIAGSELGEQQSRLALLEERERIGMELHDGIIQSLYAIGIHLDLIRQTQEASAAALSPVIDSLNGIIEDIRRYILNLKSGSDHKKTVYECLRDLVARLYVPPAVNVLIDAPNSEPPFAPSTFESICQVVNEALSNALRHANASAIRISAGQDGSMFTLVIEDDGQGFDVQGEHNGLGLRNMHRRAALHSGQIIVESSASRGTRVTLLIPT